MATLLAVGIVTATALTIVRRPFPDYDGEVRLPGLKGKVTILRDGRGVPHIYAPDVESLFRAQGYVHAQDRFFEMDLRRHVASGRLAELVGNVGEAVRSDVVVRTLGWRKVAEDELELTSPATRAALDAYAAGVNDYLRGRSPSQLSLNYTLLGTRTRLPRVEPWNTLDSLTWLKALAWDLRSDDRSELDRARIFATVNDVTRVNQLFPSYPYLERGPVTELAASAERPARRLPLPSADPGGFAWALGTDGAQSALQAARSALAAVAPLLAADGEAGSNSWVVSGALTATGKPLLATDLHLAPSIPAAFHQVGLHCQQVTQTCPYDVSGFSAAGMPGVLNGHTARVAWGMTGSHTDVTDFFLEAVIDGSYLRDGRMVPLDTREEVIQVADGSSVRIVIRATRHGPLLSDVVLSPDAGSEVPTNGLPLDRMSGYGVSVAWTGLRPGRSMDAVLAMNAATSVAELRTAAGMLSAPSQNVVCADVDGHIGYQMAGLTPARRTPAVPSAVPSDGTWPQPGWDSGHDWGRFVSPRRLPGAVDPAEGFLVAANQAPVRGDVEPRITGAWDYGYRSSRIRTRLGQATASNRRLRVSDMAAIQVDTRNGIAEELVPRLLDMEVDPFTKEAQDLLRGWDYTQPADSAAAAYFNMVWETLLDLTFADEMPDDAGLSGDGRWFEVVRRLLERPKDPWWDDRGTPGLVEARDAVLHRSLVEARERLTSRLGKDPERWRWGHPHSVELTTGRLPKDVWPMATRWLLDRGPYEADGGSSVVSAFSWNAETGGFHVTSAPSMRMVVDLADQDRSRWVNQTGVSGHAGHGNYDDQVEAWLKGWTYRWVSSERAVRARAEDELRLVPGTVSR